MQPSKYQTSLWKQVQGLPSVLMALADLASKVLLLAKAEAAAIAQLEDAQQNQAPSGPSGTPAGLTTLYIGNSCPSGYTEDTTYYQRIPRGADATYAVGVTGGSTSHSHTTLPAESVANIFDGAAFVEAGGIETALPDAHVHPIPPTPSTSTGPSPLYPWFRAFVFCKKD